MNVRKYTAGLAASALLATGFALTSGAPASADPSFNPDASAIVGVGSDTIEFVVGDLATGKDIGVTHVQGWNELHPNQKIASYNATGSSPITLRSTSAGTVSRPNGSGQGKATLFGAGDNPDVNFARSSSSLNASNGEATNLTQFPFAVDGLKIAVSGNVASNAPASLSIAQIVDIYKGTYKKWSDIDPAYANEFIHPLIPQAGSGTRSFFEAELKAANGNAAVVYPAAADGYPGVVETQEHSPNAIRDDKNAIAPFSTARAQTLGNPDSIHLEDGYNAKRAVYNVVRNADAGSQWATDIFGTGGFFCSSEAKKIIEANGFAQLASVANGGVCGQALTSAPANLSTNTVTTTTALVAATTATPNEVKLTATVDAGGQSADGKVDFFEGDTKVGTALISGGQAVKTLTGVAAGAHTYTATFVSANEVSFTSSTSPGAAIVVKESSAVATVINGRTYGHAGTAQVTVTSPAGTPTGNVTATIGATTVGTTALDANGTATFALPATLTAGTKALTVTYAGSEAIATSTLTKNFVVGRSAVTLAETFPAVVKKGKRAVGFVRVKLAPASGLKATGVVTVKLGAKVIGKGVVKNGVVKITLAKIKKGKKRLTLVYAGSANTLRRSQSFVITQK